MEVDEIFEKIFEAAKSEMDGSGELEPKIVQVTQWPNKLKPVITKINVGDAFKSFTLRKTLPSFVELMWTSALPKSIRTQVKLIAVAIVFDTWYSEHAIPEGKTIQEVEASVPFPSEDPNRTEAITITVCLKDKEAIRRYPYLRSPTQIEWQEPVVNDPRNGMSWTYDLFPKSLKDI